MADMNTKPSRHPRADQYRVEYEKGKNYAEIAKMFGVSRQAVAHACGKRDPNRFRQIAPEDCVYPYLREWMNRHKVSRRELLRRIGLVYGGDNYANLRNYLQGKTYPPKRYIDRMLQVTGLTYEKLFAAEKREPMAKYMITFVGFACVEANDKIEAEAKFNDDDRVLSDVRVTSIEEVDEFLVEA